MMVRRTMILVIDYVGHLSKKYCNPRSRWRISMIVSIYYVDPLCEFQIG